MGINPVGTIRRFDMEIGTAILVSSLISAAAMGTQTAVSAYKADEARAQQDKAQSEAKAAQEKADQDAERKRLEGVASNQTATDYGNIWGVKGSNYADAARKLSAGTGSFSDDDETNPFYSRGLI